MLNINLTLNNKPGSNGDQKSIHYHFDQDEVLVGRDEAMDVQIPHPSVSLLHLRLFRQGRALYAEDMGSTNGVLVDGVALKKECPLLLRQDALMELGLFELVLGAPRADGNVTASEDTAAFARQMVLGMLGDPSGQCPSYLEVKNGSQRGARLEIPLLTAPLVLGRAADCDLVLQDADASRRHLELRREEGRVVARDLGSKNGFLINGEVIRDSCPLKEGDELRVGQTNLVYAHLSGQALEGDGDEPSLERPPSPAVEGTNSEVFKANRSRTTEGKGLVVLSFGVGALVLFALAALVYLFS